MNPQGIGVFSESIMRTTVKDLDKWVRHALSKMSFLILGSAGVSQFPTGLMKLLKSHLCSWMAATFLLLWEMQTEETLILSSCSIIILVNYKIVLFLREKIFTNENNFAKEISRKEIVN